MNAGPSRLFKSIELMNVYRKLYYEYNERGINPEWDPNDKEFSNIGTWSDAYPVDSGSARCSV
jgi:hypothetical protein